MKTLKQYIQYLIYILMRGIFIVFRIFPIKNNKVVMNAFSGKGFCDNPKYIALELLKMRPDLDLVWIVNDLNEKMPQSIRLVKRHSISEMYELSTARLWVDNGRIPLYAVKRKKQYYIETWHGCIGMKKIGNAAKTQDFIGSSRVKHDTRLTNLMVSNSDFSDRLYREDFMYSGEILKCGSPRIDILINITDEKRNEILEELSIEKTKKIALYAPTFRDNGREDVFDIDFSRVLGALETRFGGQWIIIVKLHPVMTSKQNIFTYSENIINCSNHRDIYELMAISDVLFTDYSSVLFEMGLIYKPVFLYTKDIKELIDSRGLYFEMESLPFCFAENNDELINNIINFSDDHYKTDIDKFNQKFLKANEPGTASKSVAEYILQRIKDNEQ